MTATETKLGQAPKHSIWNGGPRHCSFFWALCLERKVKSRLWMQDTPLLPFLTLSPRHPLSSCVHEARFQPAAKKQDIWHSKGTQWGHSHGSLSFLICWLRAKWTRVSSSWGAQTWPSFSGKQTSKHIWRKALVWGLCLWLQVAFELYVTSWTLPSEVFWNSWRPCWGMSVERQTALSSELTWHRSMVCLSLWLCRTLPDMVFVTSSLLSCPGVPLRQNSAIGAPVRWSSFNGGHCHLCDSHLAQELKCTRKTTDGVLKLSLTLISWRWKSLILDNMKFLPVLGFKF